MLNQAAVGIGIANIAIDGTVLDTWFPHPELKEAGAPDAPTKAESIRLGAAELTPRMLSLVGLDEDRMVEQIAIRTSIPDLSKPPVDVHDVYLRLHLLSHRMVRPHEMNMEGTFKLLSTVVWTNKGPCLPKNFEFVRTALRSRGLIHVYCVDRLPRMVDYVVPTGIRIAEAERVRLGAYLAPGTTVLREGFVSFDSGTLGAARIEGRLSSGVLIGENTTVGLSSIVTAKIEPDGRRLPLKIGKNCHFGVSAGVLGLAVGDNFQIGNNIVIEPTSTLYFPETDTLAPASTIEGQSNWSVQLEPGCTEPVARQIEAIED